MRINLEDVKESIIRNVGPKTAEDAVNLIKHSISEMKIETEKGIMIALNYHEFDTSIVLSGFTPECHKGEIMLFRIIFGRIATEEEEQQVLQNNEDIQILTINIRGVK